MAGKVCEVICFLYEISSKNYLHSFHYNRNLAYQKTLFNTKIQPNV